MGFSILSLIEEERPANGFTTQSIPLEKILPSKSNFYDTSEIEELKESLKLFGELQNSLVCKIPETDQYRLISGHRRRLAHLALMAEGETGFETMPCLVRESNDPDTGDIMGRLMLILTNSTTRILKDWEKVQQATELKQLLLAYKDQGHKIPGGLRKYIAETLKVSETQVQRFESVSTNLIEGFKEELKSEAITISVAAELAILTPEEQEQALAIYHSQGELSVKNARYLKTAALAERDAKERHTPKEEPRQEPKETPKQEPMEQITWANIEAIDGTAMSQEEAKIVPQTLHEIQSLPKHYQATSDGLKNFEYHKNDRGFMVGDFILLKEWDGSYTGRRKQLLVTYVQEEDGLPEGYVVLGTKVLEGGW